MADKLEGSSTTGRSRSATPKPVAPKPARAKPKRKAESPTITDDLSGKFLRVGDKLYRTSDDKKPIVRIEPDRLVASNLDALPDILRIAKANGWTAINVSGGDKFKKAAFLAAAAQGLTVENYRPSKLVQADADRNRARLAEREERREEKKMN
jgi:Large polyvalent protein-associated domain 7